MRYVKTAGQISQTAPTGADLTMTNSTDGGDFMITCGVCGHLNDPSRATCEECGSDLSDSPDWDIYDIDDFGDDMLDFDDAEELGYVDPDDYE